MQLFIIFAVLFALIGISESVKSPHQMHRRDLEKRIREEKKFHSPLPLCQKRHRKHRKAPLKKPHKRQTVQKPILPEKKEEDEIIYGVSLSSVTGYEKPMRPLQIINFDLPAMIDQIPPIMADFDLILDLPSGIDLFAERTGLVDQNSREN